MDRLQDIFEHKRKSSAKFRAVQRRLGLLLAPEDMRADPATREGTQELHKGLHWINLELAEYLYARPDERPEELADVLHFLVEFALLLGYDHTIVPDFGDPAYPKLDRLDVMLEASMNDVLVMPDPEANARFCICAALRVADLLKNKPWKQSLKPPPDPEKLYQMVSSIFYWYGAVVRTQGMSAQDLYEQFIRKEEINNTRVDTGV